MCVLYYISMYIINVFKYIVCILTREFLQSILDIRVNIHNNKLIMITRINTMFINILLNIL